MLWESNKGGKKNTQNNKWHTTMYLLLRLAVAAVAVVVVADHPRVAVEQS